MVGTSNKSVPVAWPLILGDLIFMRCCELSSVTVLTFDKKPLRFSTEPVLAQRQEKGLGMEIIPCPIHTKIPFTLYQYSNPFSSVFHDYSISTNHHYYNSSGIISLVM